MSDEAVDRQIALMETLGLWYSRVVGPWIEDGGVAARIGEVFPVERSIQFFCDCDELGWHAFYADSPCLSKDPEVIEKPFKGKRGKPAAKRMEQMVESLERGYSRHSVVAGTRLTTGKLSRLSAVHFEGQPPIGDRNFRRMVLPDGRWYAIQERYYQGVMRLGTVDRWEAVYLPMPSTTVIALREYPILVGLSADNLVSAFVMPIHDECNHTPILELAGAPA